MATVSSKPVQRQFSDRGEEICPVCCSEADAWSVGSCNHYVCLTCSVRLRVLCEKTECPVCREKNEKVVVVQTPQPYSTPRSFISDKKYGFVFSKSSLAQVYDNIKAIRCKVCDKRGMTNTRQLSDHLRRDHALLMCKICVQHLKLFSYEHKLYTRHELVRHWREGDPDDKSHKGHPQCEFCDERYFGKDELFYHLKENHFWCHFCENDGNHDYYPSYELLKGHFRSSHFLCEEGVCRNEKYTNVFLSKLDLQVHKAKIHTKGLTKSEAKQLRQVDVGFTYTRKERGVDDQPPRVHRRSYRHHYHGGGTFDKDMEKAISASLTSCNQQQVKKDSSTSNGHTNTTITTLKGGGGGGGVVIDDKPLPLISEATSNDPPSPQIVKKSIKHPPPGLEHVVPTVSASGGGSDTHTDDDKRDEWPSLGLEPSYKTQSCSRPSTVPPPGFSVPPPGLETNNKPFTEHDILREAVRILKNNPDKVNYFKAISGQFQKGQMNVTDYSNECYTLFGNDWVEFGIRLASTLPDQDKRQGLVSRLINISSKGRGITNVPKPPPGFATMDSSNPVLSSTKENNSSNKKTTKKRNRNKGNEPKGAWQSGRHLDSSSILQDSEFPCLNTSTLMVNPGRGGMARSSWNMKVAATVK